MLNEDYRDMLSALSAEKADFILVGAYAMAVHGHVRATLDMDLWVMPSPENAEAVLRALQRFGAPSHGVTVVDLQKDDTILLIGAIPRRIDVLTGLSGLTFEAAYARALVKHIDGIDVRVLSLDDLIENKRATGRARDLDDADALKALKKDGTST